MKILVHICCAPCFVYPYRVLSQEGFDLCGFFFNPNIHPYLEYRRRLETLQQWTEIEGIRVLYQDDYQLENFLRGVVYHENDRCSFCYRLRLETTAHVAAKGKFDYFTSTLLYSKYQKHDTILNIGQELASQYEVPFFYRDFREGWQEGICLSKEYGLYRQPYCGCIYSEKERYLKKRIKQQAV